MYQLSNWIYFAEIINQFSRCAQLHIFEEIALESRSVRDQIKKNFEK